MDFRLRFLRIAVVPLLLTMVIATAFSREQIRPKHTGQPQPGQSASRYDLPTPTDLESVQILRSVLNRQSARGRTLSANATTSPGIEICGGVYGGTSYDYQTNDDNQRMIALSGAPGDPFVHFAWTNWEISDSLGQSYRYAATGCWSQSGGLGLGGCGIEVVPAGNPSYARSGVPTVDVASDGTPHVAFHARDEESQSTLGPYSTFIADFDSQCIDLFNAEELADSRDPQAIWPHLAIDRNAGTARAADVYHVCSHPTGDGPDPSFDDEILYWRRVGEAPAVWEGPVALDRNAGFLNYHVAVDPTSDRAAVFYIRDNLDPLKYLQVGYLESQDNGADWIAAGTPIYPNIIEPSLYPGYVPLTSYFGTQSPQAWVECSGEYDFDGIKHAVWIEQVYPNFSPDCRVMHWDELSGARAFKQALNWNNQGGHGGRDLWLALPNIAFGDGSTICTDGPGDLTNYNYVYVTYEQYGGPTVEEQSDISASDAMQNLEIYLAVSNDGGATFSPSVNLTNTKTPGCSGDEPGNECASERDPSLAKLVNDTIHLMYILDKDAGDAVFGQGLWTFNPVMYYRIPGGTDAEFLCPTIAPSFAAELTNQDPACEYHAAYNIGAGPQQQVEDLFIENFGSATLSGTVSENPPVDWLVLANGPYAIPAGSPQQVRTVTLDASATSVQNAGEGLFQSSIEVTHNDTTQPSPFVIPIDFFVFDEFYCPEYVTLNTGWLWLEVSNVERQGVQSREEGGLARLDPASGDTSYSIYDASLLIGVPPNPDTIVFRNIYGEGNGQPGFRALSALDIDTFRYGSDWGYASATARQTTTDSTLGIDVEYIFPQDPDSCEFVLVKYQISNRTGSTINDLVIGQATDFDVVPGHDADILQIGTQNTGHLRPDFNLVYQQGADTTGHVIVGDRTATRWKGGITAIQTFPAPHAWVAPNNPWLDGAPGQGFHETYLYREMTESSFELFPPEDPDPEEDLHTVMVMEQDVDLGLADVRHYIVGYVSSNTGVDDADLIATTRKAWRYSFGWEEFTVLDSIPNPATPVSYPYYAIGTHEDGIASGCNGCIVSEIDDPDGVFNIVPSSDPCHGTIEFSGAGSDVTYEATYLLTDSCSTYHDEITITVVVGEPAHCDCPHPGDLDGNNQYDAVDLNALIQVLYYNKIIPLDSLCPIHRADIDGDGVTDGVDFQLMIHVIFFNGLNPCDPCFPFATYCVDRWRQ